MLFCSFICAAETSRRWRVFIFAHVYPAQRDEIVLVLNEEELLLVFRVAVVGPTTLLGHEDVGHGERIPGLEQTQK